MKPGIYRNMSVADYDAIPAVRRTFVWNLYDQSPGHAVYKRDNRQPKKAWDDGTMVHTALLQPEEFPREYVVMPPFEADPGNLKADGKAPSPENARRTSYYKSKVKQFAKMCESTGAKVIEQRDYDMAYAIGQGIREHPITSRFFQRGSSNEAVVVAEDPATGLLLKARFDCLVEQGMPTGIDIKTTADAHPRAFQQSVRKFGYYFQAAWYLHLLDLVGLKNANFLFVAGEKTPPYPVVVYECEESTLRLGALHVSKALATYQECEKSGVWPYYGLGIETIQLSDFDLKELEKDHD